MSLFWFLRRVSFFVLICILFINYLNANQDSLISLLSKKSGADKVDLLSEISWNFRGVDYNKAIEFANKAIDLSHQIKYVKGEANAFNDLGIYYFDKQKYSKAIECYDKSLSLRKLINDSLGIASIYNKKGIIFQVQGEYKKVIELQLKALEIYELLNEFSYISYTLNNLAVLNYTINNYKQSLYYHFKAVEIRNQIQDFEGIAISFQNIATVFYDLSMPDSSFVYLKKAEEFFYKTDSTFNYLPTVYNNLGVYYLQNKDFKNANEYLIKAYQYRKQKEDIVGLSSTALELGKLFFYQGEYKQSEKYFNESINYAHLTGNKLILKNNYEFLTTVSEKEGNFKQALNYHKLYQSYSDSLLNQETLDKVNELQIKFESQKKEIENLQLKNDLTLKSTAHERSEKQKTKIVFISASLILILLFVFIFYYQILKQRHKTEEERILNKAFFEGEQNERIRIARDLHDSIGQMLSVIKMKINSLNNVNDNDTSEKLSESTILLEKTISEVRHISHNLIPEELNFGLHSAIEEIASSINNSGKLQVDYSISENASISNIPKQLEINIYRILQELLNNMVKHSGASKIVINIYFEDGILKINLEDNGSGFDLKMIEKSEGIGWKNIMARINLINGKFSVQSEKNSGTHIFILIPV